MPHAQTLDDPQVGLGARGKSEAKSTRQSHVRLSIKEDFARELKELAEMHAMQKSILPQHRMAVLSSTDELAKNPLSGGEEGSGQVKQFSPLKESDLAVTASPPSVFCPPIPSVSPVLGPLIPPSDKSSAGNPSKKSSQSIGKSGLMQLQELEPRTSQHPPRRRGPTAKSTEDYQEHAYYARYSTAMENSGGAFSNKWYIPVQCVENKYFTLDSHPLELYTSYSSPLQVAEGRILLNVHRWPNCGGDRSVLNKHRGAG